MQLPKMRVFSCCVFLVCALTSCAANVDSEEKPSIAISSYRKLFKEKRRMQLDAVKTIMGMKTTDTDRQEKTVQKLTETMFKVIFKSRLLIQNSGFIAGMEFPTSNDELREAVSNVLENVAFFADLVLRLPDITSRFYSGNRELKQNIDWAIGFAQETGFYDNQIDKLMHLVSQELNIIPREEDYVNPYRNTAKDMSTMDIELEALLVSKKAIAEKKKKEKDQKKKRNKGPKLSGGRKNEL